jgi:uncharacterized protein (DUF362 family)
MKTEVFITKTKAITTNELMDSVRECFDHFGGVDTFIRGNVFIKMNATTVDPTAITTPEVIFATIKIVQETKNKTKNVYVFDNTAIGMPTRVVFKLDRLAKRIKKLGAKPLYLDEEKSIKLDFGGVALDKLVPFPKILFENLIEHKEENTYLNVPKLKTHLQAGLTACVKNQHGLLYDSEKLYNHHMIDEKIIDIYTKIKPDFNIVDATRVLNNGAVSFSDDWQIPMNLLLAGRDAVALDTVGAELLGIPKSNIKYLKMASDRNLGCSNLNNIEIAPNKSILDENKIALNDMFENITLDMPNNFRIISGKERAGCRAGCKSLLEYFKLVTTGAEILPVTGICGKGHDISELDQINGSILLVGPCPIEELRNYFENRPDRDKLKIYYLNDHFPITDFAKPFRKVAKLPLKQLSLMMKISMIKLLSGYISAKRRDANFLGMI